MSKRQGPNKTKNVALVIIVVFFSCIEGPRLVSCQKNGAGSGSGGAGMEILAQQMYKAMSNYTSIFKSAIKKELGYCILDV